MFLPFITTNFYLVSCYYLYQHQVFLKNLYSNSIVYKNIIKNISIIHNTGLTIFSFYTFVSLYNLIKYEYNSLTPQVWFENDSVTNVHIINICWIFLYSKIWEFLDTWIIMLKGGDTIFLQKFHHFGAVWVWYIGCYYNTSSIILPTFYNSFIHTIMYFYYLLCLFGIKLTPIKPIITLSQLLQLSLGNYFVIKDYILPRSYINEHVIGSSIFCLYVFVLIFLFIKFSIKSYLHNHDLVRSVMLWICFTIGLYNTICYDNIDLYEKNVMIQLLPFIFIGYLLYDLSKMICNKILFRIDLIYHHLFCVIVYSLLTTSIPKTGSWLVLAENISLFNYFFRNNFKTLLIYRIVIILLCRMPGWFYILYISHYNEVYYIQLNSLDIIRKISFSKGPLLFVLYDIYLLKQMFVKLNTINKTTNNTKIC